MICCHWLPWPLPSCCSFSYGAAGNFLGRRQINGWRGMMKASMELLWIKAKFQGLRNSHGNHDVPPDAFGSNASKKYSDVFARLWSHRLQSQISQSIFSITRHSIIACIAASLNCESSRQQPSWHHVLRMSTKFRSYFWYYHHLSSIKDAHGSPIKCVSLCMCARFITLYLKNRYKHLQKTNSFRVRVIMSHHKSSIALNSLF